MVYPKSKLGQKYMSYMTDTPYWYIAIVTIGVILIIVMMLRTDVEIMETYTAQLKHQGNNVTLSIQASVSAEKAYLYTNKQQNVYPLTLQEIHQQSPGTSWILIDEDIQKVSTFVNSSEEVYVDLPIRSVNLLTLIFVRGGRSLE